MPDIAYNVIGIPALQKSEPFSAFNVTLEELTDAQLLERYTSSGNEAAFRELVVRYKNHLYAYLNQFLNRQDLVEDVFQETFLQLFSSRDKFDTSRPLQPWLFTIAANKARDAIRKLQHTNEVPIGKIADSQELSFNEVLSALASDNSTPPDKLEKNETILLVREIISNMPVNFREILIFAYFNRFSYKQIAEILSIPVGTVKSRLHTAVGYFAKLWKSMYENVAIK